MVEHQVTLQGFSFDKQNVFVKKVSPTVLARTDQEFISAILNELKTNEGRALLKSTVNTKTDDDNVARLFQPVHRTFHIALFELFCEEPGFPRVDPKKIESAGLVIRRKTELSKGEPSLEAWMQAGDKIQGWVTLTDEQKLQDPDPNYRPLKLRSGNAEIDNKLLQRNLSTELIAPYSEAFSPLFVAPPEVCKAAKKTILYALIPLTSNEVSEAEVALPSYGSSSFSETDPVYLHLSKLLTQTLNTRTYNWNNKEITRSDLNDGLNNASKSIRNDWEALTSGLEQLLVEFDAFGESAESKALFDSLQLIQLPYEKNSGEVYFKNGGTVLKQATELLVQYSDSITKLEMPIYWPEISKKIQIKIWQAATIALTKRAKQINPGIGRYDELDKHYQLEGFVRVKQNPKCPPRLIWSGASEMFAIAPWYESGDVPPVRISLPDVTDKSFLKKLKPSVAFAMPESLFNAMKGTKLEALMEGKKPDKGPSIGLGWICGFNIPIITFCAFIVLSIFLSLLNIIFQWLLFVKICIPFPVKK